MSETAGASTGPQGESGLVLLPSLETNNQQSILIKWSGKEYEVDISSAKTVGDLKTRIKDRTGVNTDRQKLLNIVFKGTVLGVRWRGCGSHISTCISGKQASDSCLLSNLNLKPGFKIMMMGSLEKDIETVDVPPEDRPEIQNDLDIPDDDEVEPTESREVYLEKISRRVREYKVNILNPPRPGKKLLVLDIDYTLFDHRSTASRGDELMRPGLHEFLTRAYQVRPELDKLRNS